MSRVSTSRSASPATSPRTVSQPFITLQWHLTHRCNWRCTHCYHDTYEGSELPLSALKQIYADFLALADSRGLAPELVVTGGEPFVRADFLDLLAHISTHRGSLRRLTILTNGSFLTDEILAEIRRRAPAVSGIQISLEGDEELNDAIRGRGAFQKILAAIPRVAAAGIPLHLAATISKLNAKEMWKLLDVLVVYDVPLVLRRFVPIGGGAARAALLSPTELKRVYEKAAQINASTRLANGDEVLRTNTCTGGMQELLWPGLPHRRSCGVRHRRIMTLMPDGEVYPCRLLPTSIGNVTHTSLAEIYDGAYAELANAANSAAACAGCAAFHRCRGGALCVTHAVTGKLSGRDPQCWSKAKYKKKNAK